MSNYLVALVTMCLGLLIIRYRYEINDFFGNFLPKGAWYRWRLVNIGLMGVALVALAVWWIIYFTYNYLR
jgi:hypothetical protein